MAAVVEIVLAGLDEDLLEYVTGLCEDTDDDGDLAEAAAAFCLSSELCEDEDDAEAKAQELLKALGRGASKPCCGGEAAVAQGTKTAGAERRAGGREERLHGATSPAPVQQTTRAPPKRRSRKKHRKA